MASPKDDSPGRLLAATEETKSDSSSEEGQTGLIGGDGAAGGTNSQAGPTTGDDGEYVEEDESEDTKDSSEDESEDEAALATLAGTSGSSAAPGSSTGAQGGAAATPAAAAARRFDSYVGQGGSTITPEDHWRFQRALATPLAFEVPSDATGGVETRVLVGNVDFNNRDDVRKANRYIRQLRGRARERIGLQKLGPDLRDRVITQVQHNWLLTEYHRYAAANNGRRITNPELTRRFNAHFQEAQLRSDLSIAGYVSRQADIGAVKYSYRGR